MIRLGFELAENGLSKGLGQAQRWLRRGSGGRRKTTTPHTHPLSPPIVPPSPPSLSPLLGSNSGVDLGGGPGWWIWVVDLGECLPG